MYRYFCFLLFINIAISQTNTFNIDKFSKPCHEKIILADSLNINEINKDFKNQISIVTNLIYKKLISRYQGVLILKNINKL